MTPAHPSDPALVPFEPAHARPAAALVASRVRALRDEVPALPSAWTDEAALARLLSGIAVHGSGVAAVRGDMLVAFQAATLVDGHGGRWAYTPDFAHHAPDDPGGRLVESVYARLADGWARQACLEHVVTALANDAATIATLVRLGFGQTVIDLVRDLSPVEDRSPVPGVAVRQAGPGDTADVMVLAEGLAHHLAESPVFLRVAPARAPELHRRILADPDQGTFIAEADGRAIATLRIGPPATDVAMIVRDPGTASITAAFTVPEWRGAGVATLLLDAAVAWARERAFVRAAVDHESANGEAYRFWARHFSTVAVSLTRRLPSRVAG